VFLSLKTTSNARRPDPPHGFIRYDPPPNAQKLRFYYGFSGFLRQREIVWKPARSAYPYGFGRE